MSAPPPPAPRPDPAIDPLRFRKVLAHYPTGVSAITSSLPDGSPVGMIVGTFTSVSLDPPLVAFFPSRTSASFPAIQAAGRFCANVLGAEQELVCRDLAATGPDKFKRVAWRPSPLGNPILEGCVAWVDCEIADVVDAGDHMIVIGRVTELERDSRRLPLLFFQGGYGSFSVPTAPAADLVGQLRRVDSVRHQMQRLAGDLGVECLAVSLVDEDMVITGSAGRPQNRSVLTRLGQRIPHVPPMGAGFVAWSDERAIAAWLDRAAEDDEKSRALYREMLARVRERGWSLALDLPGLRRLEAVVFHLPDEADRDTVSEVAHVLAGLGEAYEPAHLDDDASHPVNNMMAPVFDADGAVTLLLALYGLPKAMSSGQIAMCAERLRTTAAEASRTLASSRQLSSPR